MNHNTNQKINQATESTLLIGVDIAKDTHYACPVDFRGRVLKKAFAIKQSRVGFDQFIRTVHKLQIQFDKTDVLVGFEPTGHYWLNLAEELMNHDIPFVLVNPMHVNRTKELDDNLQTKNDQKDARVIAKLMRDGVFSFPRYLEGVEAELRSAATLRTKLVENLTAIKNRMIRWTDRFFPEFQLVFPTFGKNACAVLEKTPLPQDLVGQDIEELLKVYKQVNGLKCPSRPKIKQIQNVAEQSVGITEGLEIARFEIATLLSQFQYISQQLEVLDKKMTGYAKQLPEYEYISSVPGIGGNSVKMLLSEIGSFSHYKHPRQIIKLAGLTLRENSSGKHKGQKKISKRGRKDLRATLYRMTLPLIQHNPAFRELYDYYISRPINPLSGKEALVVLCSKVIKILHALSHKQVYFSAEAMMKDLHCLKEVA